MPTDNHHEDPIPQEVKYASDEPTPKAVAVAAAGIVGFVLAASVIAAALVSIPGVVPKTEAPTGPFARTEPPKGDPLLQTNITNTTDIRDLRQHEMAFLTTYGREASNTPVGQTYRIPIDKAIDIVASQQSLDPTQSWFKQSTNPVQGQLASTPAGPKADPSAQSMQLPEGTAPQAGAGQAAASAPLPSGASAPEGGSSQGSSLSMSAVKPAVKHSDKADVKSADKASSSHKGGGM